MQQLLGDEARDLEASLAEEPSTGIRINTLKLTPEEFEAISPWPLRAVPWCPSGYVLPAGSRPGLHPFHRAGLYYVQDPSAMAVAEALAPAPGERILDLAAAPGGKSTHTAALLQGSGLLVANDVETVRARELSRNLERWGARNAVVISATASELAERWPGSFDAVLLDAPCSGEGMFRKSSEALERWSEELVASCASTQSRLITAAARLVRAGGRLIYSTCTLGPEENEGVIEQFLQSHPEWTLSPHGLIGVDSARPEWVAGRGSDTRYDLSRAARLWPHRQAGEGHFLALLHKSREAPEEVATPRHARRRRAERGSGDEGELRRAREAWRRFAEEELSGDPLPEHNLRLRRDGLYAVPPESPDLDRLRILRAGVWLGTPERRGFRPSHALALLLTGEQARRSLDLSPDSPELAAYLEGAEVTSDGEDGWLLVTVKGHPLGWGRRARGIVKNHYPKGLRVRG